ncbi:MAG TPA: hypothetical protein VE974_00925 [Thermoanaerobaculia bacterium]|nr:hypothetical protein [Thermoanaerobaculia bacterium]
MSASMINIAAECLKTGRTSVWSIHLGKYVCSDSEEGREALRDQQEVAAHAHAINPQFKLVFLTAAGGTVLFVLLCLVLSLLAGKEPPPLFEKIIMGFFDMAKIGFGAMVGLLGGKKLQSPVSHGGVDSAGS